MLTDLAIRRLQPRERRFMVLDSDGLYLEVMPTGEKYWRLRLYEGKRERKRSLGRYPDISAKDARLERDKIRVLRAQGDYDPTPSSDSDSFADLAEEWFRTQVVPTYSPKHIQKIRSRLDRIVLPAFRKTPLNGVTSSKILVIAREFESRKMREIAHRIVWMIGQIMRFGIAMGRAATDPTGGLRGALSPVVPVHHPSVTKPDEIGALMRAIDGMDGFIVVRAALLFSAFTFCRPGEIRKAEWAEIDEGRAEWRIPAEKMKARRVHLVPLSRQALAALASVRPFTGGGRYVFPSSRTADRPMSDGTVNAALRRLGYAQGEMTAHGFRSMASTILNESGRWPPDAIERQLAHVEGNSVRAAYNYAQHIEARREMMQWWGDWLDSLREGA